MATTMTEVKVKNIVNDLLDQFKEEVIEEITEKTLAPLKEDVGTAITKWLDEAREKLQETDLLGNELTNGVVVPHGAVLFWHGDMPVPEGWEIVRHLGMRNGYVHIKEIDYSSEPLAIHDEDLIRAEEEKKEEVNA